MDYAASTPLDTDVFKKMKPYWNIHFGNAGALHKEGVLAKKVLNEARGSIARLISSKAEEIIFTGSGTEGNNLAIMGYVNGFLKNESSIKNPHIITSSAEHPSVIECFRALEKDGVSVDMIDFNSKGIIEPEKIKKLFKKETIFVSISFVNNEIGTLQPIKDISREIKSYERKMGTKIVFHTDASQAPLYFDCTPDNLGVDLMTIDGQKIYGPKGVGFLYKRKNILLESIIKGGNQEYGLRPGTENIPLIVGMKESFSKAVFNRENETKKIKTLQDYFLELLEKNIPSAVLNGDRIMRSPNNVNISIPNIDNEYLVIALDENNIYASTKSACLGHSKELSRVVSSLYKGNLEYMKSIKSAIRFSLGRENKKGDIDHVISVLFKEIKKLDIIGL